jgi:hypothetical protein
MPYDGSGNFVSLGPPYFPEVTGQVISSTYFNALMNDVFTGMSTALCRDGQSTVSGHFNWNSKNLTGVSSLGSATLTVTGNSTIGGTLGVSGLVTVTGASETIRIKSADEQPFITGYNAAGSTRFGYLQFQTGLTRLESSTGDIRLATAGTDRLTIAAAGAALFSGTLTVTGRTTFNADANYYAELSGSNPIISLDSGNDYFIYNRAANTGGFVVGGTQILAYNTGGVGIAGALTVSTTGTFATGVIVTAGGLTVTAGGLTVSASGIAVTGNSSITGTLAVSGALTQAGNQVWHAGNLVKGVAASTDLPTRADADARYALLSGAAFTGTESFGDTNHSLQVTGGNARHTLDSTDYMEYDRTANKLYFYGGGVAYMSINLTNGNILTKGTIGASQVAV